ncbi:mitogen-activated protein kinase kinase kinase 18-like [Prosopis cineraria]|uniref:mitogen-activated protein kinase kinase kinase 18-like n=1 Tax=Prosopis cineraria TaxID=364024 RepID=UPI00240F24B3|nr:mitogen-activated protein kinase kinase kinase 18-like [Prosopis cineraria]
MDWSRGPTVGRGATATVSIARDCRSGRLFAVKSAELNRSELLQREQKILSTLKSAHIVAYQGFDITSERNVLWYNLFMEYAPYGTLADMTRRRDGLDEAVVRTYARQILLGLDHLHSNGIVHCDIKGKNVLITEEGAKIADLGCARRGADAVDCGGLVAGTPLFMAPEVARGEQQGFAADVWSLGCTVLEMITGKAPWPDVADPLSAVYRIGFSGDVPEIPGFMSEKGRDFVSKCLKRDPNERWSVAELLRHAFVEESTSSKSSMEEFESSKLDTPTSVIDGSIWDSWETTQDPTRVRSSNPGRDRIRRLCAEATTSFDCNEPNWGWDDEEWVTVRNSNETSENYNVDLGHEGSLVHCYEPKTVITIGLWLCNNVNCKVCCNGSNYISCNKGLMLGYDDWSYVRMIVLKREIESQNKERIFHGLLLSLTL